MDLENIKYQRPEENDVLRQRNLYSPLNIVRVIKLIRMRKEWHAACMRQIINSYKILGDIRIDGRILLKWIVHKYGIKE
jgi:hypothetical protein